MSEQRQLFQIRNKDGLFSKGSRPGLIGAVQYSKYGKVWASKLALHGHISLIENDDYRGLNPKDVYVDCDVIIIDITSETIRVMPFSEYYDTIWAKRKRK